MKTDVLLTDACVGRYMVVRAGNRSIPVQIVSVGGGRCGWMVLDESMPLRSGKVRFDEGKKYTIYDTAEEILSVDRE
jgi:hypothetical protein